LVLQQSTLMLNKILGELRLVFHRYFKYQEGLGRLVTE
jgi:hypothetical protein